MTTSALPSPSPSPSPPLTVPVQVPISPALDTYKEREGDEIIGPYQIGSTLGRGIFACVRIGRDEYRQSVAIKIFDKLTLQKNPHQRAQVDKELFALLKLRHKNIVTFFEVLETSDRIYLVMEHLKGGELYDFILDRGRCTEREAASLFGQICDAVHYCHSMGVAHRDLKPENILLHDSSPHICKLVDFGLATTFELSESKERSLNTQCGSPHYASPEILTGQRYSGTCSDVWSLGVLLYALLCGSLPFNARSVPLLIKKIVEGKYKFPKYLSANARDLITQILNLTPEARPSVAQILQHPFLQLYASADSLPSSPPSDPLNSNTIGLFLNPALPSNGSSINELPLPILPTLLPSSRPLSRPEVINPESSRPQPGDLQRLVTKHNASRRSLAHEFSPALADAMPMEDPILPPIVMSLPRSFKTIVCRSCGKPLSAPLADIRQWHSSDNNLCTCIKPTRTQSPSRSSSQSALKDSPLSQSQSSSLREHSHSTSDGFETQSMRENYFHPNDTQRKTHLTATESVPLTLAEQARLAEEEAIRHENETMFLHACEEGDTDEVLSLIESPLDEAGFMIGPPLVDIRAKAVDNWTGLHFAARSGHLAVVQALMHCMQPLDIDSRTKSGWSALMCAADQGHEEVCALLIKYGAAIHICNTDGKSAIFLARERGYHAIAQLLTTASSLRHKRHALLSTAVIASSPDQRPNGMTDTRDLNYELFRAAEWGDVDKVKHLLSLRSNQEQESHISRRAHPPSTTTIVDNEAHSSACGSALSVSSTSSLIAASPRYFVDVTSRGIDHWTALHFAARKGRTAVVSMLLAHDPPAPINAVTKNGWTPLMLACDKGYVEVVALLLANGADVLLVSSDGYTAASVAQESQNEKCYDLVTQYASQKSALEIANFCSH